MQVVYFILFIFKISCAHEVFEIDDSWKLDDATVLKSSSFWIDDAQRALQEKVFRKLNRNEAKNVIFFIGDGMSIPTVTASRIYDGQVKGIVGERNTLFMERFPYVGLSKTYCVDKQVADSACTATAYFTGVKTNSETIGVSAKVEPTDCRGATLAENQLESILSWAQDAGMATGIVTTTHITHASPAGAYAHSSHRDYESDADIKRIGNDDPSPCIDIGRQLVENSVSKQFDVVMGGGARKLLPSGTDEYTGFEGERLDGRNLITEWSNSRCNSTFVYTRQQLLDIDYNNIDSLIGIFANSHLDYNLDSDGSQPTLEEMTGAAINILSKNSNGFFLFVEGGRIDHAHHQTMAKKALDETVQLDKAIQLAYELTNPNDTLIVISADHGHTMTINGYPDIGNSITGVGTGISNMDHLPYTTLSYANGPAFNNFLYSNSDHEQGGVQRYNVSQMPSVGDKDFQYPSVVPLFYETHEGSDVAVHASGPWSHLFTGVLEQNVLPVFMSFAACIGPGPINACNYDGGS